MKNVCRHRHLIIVLTKTKTMHLYILLYEFKFMGLQLGHDNVLSVMYDTKKGYYLFNLKIKRNLIS